MLQDYRIALAIIAATGFAVYGVSHFPSLTTVDSPAPNAADPARAAAIFGRELAYCQENAADLDCRCFADISGAIQARERARLSGWVYADKQELARWQARDSC